MRTCRRRQILRVVAVAAGLALAGGGVALADDPPAPGEAPVDEKAEAERIAALIARTRSTDLETRRAAAVEAASEQHAGVTTTLAHLLSDPDPEVRRSAIEGLGKRTDGASKKPAAAALAGRLPRLAEKSEMKDELLKAVAALHDLAQPVAIKALLDDLPAIAEPEVLEARLMAVANVPAAQAIEELIDLLARGRRGADLLRRHTAEALRSATGQNLGGNPDAWRAWWREHDEDFDYAAAAAKRREAEAAAAAKAERAGNKGRKPPEKKPDPPPKTD